jgi:hypothetical protein
MQQKANKYNTLIPKIFFNESNVSGVVCFKKIQKTGNECFRYTQGINVLNSNVSGYISLQTDARLRSTNAFEMNYVKFKRCDNMMVVLYVPTPSNDCCIISNEDRRDVKDKRFAKFRASEAWPICILNTTTGEFLPSYWHVNIYYAPILYIINQWVMSPNGYERNQNVICAQGIHFFNHWLAAYCYESAYFYGSIAFDESGKILVIWYQHRPLYESKITYNDIVEAFLSHFTFFI